MAVTVQPTKTRKPARRWHDSRHADVMAAMVELPQIVIALDTTQPT